MWQLFPQPLALTLIVNHCCMAKSFPGLSVSFITRAKTDNRTRDCVCVFMNDKQEEEQMRERETETENSWKYKLQWVLTFLIISLSRLEAKKITPEVTRVAEWTYTYTSICTHFHTHNPIHLPPLAPPARSSYLSLSAWLPPPHRFPLYSYQNFILPLSCSHSLCTKCM